MAASWNLPALAADIAAAMDTSEVARDAAQQLALCQSLGLISDWEGCPKVDDFARLLVAAGSVLPPGGSIETGVFRGGTAGPLILTAPPDSFHVSIDPYGLASQSYDLPQYGLWPEVRRTLAQLAVLGERRGVTFCHFLTDSLSFIQGDLLPWPASFRFVHLDGDHSEDVVQRELSYFRRRLPGPALFILDDHDDHFPGVESALQDQGAGMVRILHRFYAFPNYGTAGFSAWLHAAG